MRPTETRKVRQVQRPQPGSLKMHLNTGASDQDVAHSVLDMLHAHDGRSSWAPKFSPHDSSDRRPGFVGVGRNSCSGHDSA